jgi:hypothetical protein
MINYKICREGHIKDISWNKCPVCISPVCGWFVYLNPENKNIIFTLHEGRHKIGTGMDCEIRILFDSISRHHALFSSINKKYFISDMNSSGGTFINNRQIVSSQIIDNDIIRFGDHEFKFKCL